MQQRIAGLLAGAAMALANAPNGAAQDLDAPIVPELPARTSAHVTAGQLLDMADTAKRGGDLATAEKIYSALYLDPAVAVRNEARFRMALIHIGAHRLPAAAVLLREILDVEPKAQRVRLELARVLDMMGDEAGARRALREAQAGGLPAEVARFVDRYSAALRAQKPLGASIDIALAPDSNINRATRSQTLGTILGDFIIDESAKQRSGIGLTLSGQAYLRHLLGGETNLLGRISGSADLYRDASFNDMALAVTVGPELHSGTDRIALEAGGLWRWYGGRPYSRAATIGLTVSHPLGRRALLRIAASAAFIGNRFNDLQSGRTVSASLTYERALSSRAGVALSLSLDRQALRDRGYSSWGGQVILSAYREIGPMTLIATLGHGRLIADERLPLFADARSDQSYRASLGATFRALRIGTFAPFVRASYERNRSTSAIYDYRKLRTEIGLSRAF